LAPILGQPCEFQVIGGGGEPPEQEGANVWVVASGLGFGFGVCGLAALARFIQKRSPKR
jgi:hypothetical protein